MATSIKALKTRQLLLEAARTLILEEGIERLSMDRIAQRAGLSKGAVMYHFKTKRAVEAALLEDYAAHLERGLAEHEALFAGLPEETFIPGYLEWFRSFERNSHGWAEVGIELLTLQHSDPELLEPVRRWYRKLYARAEALPERIRPKALLVVMALEGFFYTHKFGIDLMSAGARETVYGQMLELTRTAGVERRQGAEAAEEPLVSEP